MCTVTWVLLQDCFWYCSTNISYTMLLLNVLVKMLQLSEEEPNLPVLSYAVQSDQIHYQMHNYSYLYQLYRSIEYEYLRRRTTGACEEHSGWVRLLVFTDRLPSVGSFSFIYHNIVITKTSMTDSIFKEYIDYLIGLGIFS